MPERDLIQQLDRAVEAMLAGSPAAAGPEVTELVRIAGWLRDLPDEDFPEKCFPTLLSVVVIRSAVEARAISEASGSASRKKTCMARSPEALASRASGASRYRGAASLSATRIAASSHSERRKAWTRSRSR
jgi:hypothetical protein